MPFPNFWTCKREVAVNNSQVGIPTNAFSRGALGKFGYLPKPEMAGATKRVPDLNPLQWFVQRVSDDISGIVAKGAGRRASPKEVREVRKNSRQIANLLGSLTGSIDNPEDRKRIARSLADVVECAPKRPSSDTEKTEMSRRRGAQESLEFYLGKLTNDELLVVYVTACTALKAEQQKMSDDIVLLCGRRGEGEIKLVLEEIAQTIESQCEKRLASYLYSYASCGDMSPSKPNQALVSLSRMLVDRKAAGGRHNMIWPKEKINGWFNRRVDDLSVDELSHYEKLINRMHFECADGKEINEEVKTGLSRIRDATVKELWMAKCLRDMGIAITQDSIDKMKVLFDSDFIDDGRVITALYGLHLSSDFDGFKGDFFSLDHNGFLDLCESINVGKALVCMQGAIEARLNVLYDIEIKKLVGDPKNGTEGKPLVAMRAPEIASDLAGLCDHICSIKGKQEALLTRGGEGGIQLAKRVCQLLDHLDERLKAVNVQDGVNGTELAALNTKMVEMGEKIEESIKIIKKLSNGEVRNGNNPDVAYKNLVVNLKKKSDVEKNDVRKQITGLRNAIEERDVYETMARLFVVGRRYAGDWISKDDLGDATVWACEAVNKLLRDGDFIKEISHENLRKSLELLRKYNNKLPKVQPSEDPNSFVVRRRARRPSPSGSKNRTDGVSSRREVITAEALEDRLAKLVGGFRFNLLMEPFEKMSSERKEQGLPSEMIAGLKAARENLKSPSEGTIDRIKIAKNLFRLDSNLHSILPLLSEEEMRDYKKLSQELRQQLLDLSKLNSVQLIDLRSAIDQEPDFEVNTVLISLREALVARVEEGLEGDNLLRKAIDERTYFGALKALIKENRDVENIYGLSRTEALRDLFTRFNLSVNSRLKDALGKGQFDVAFNILVKLRVAVRVMDESNEEKLAHILSAALDAGNQEFRASLQVQLSDSESRWHSRGFPVGENLQFQVGNLVDLTDDQQERLLLLLLAMDDVLAQRVSDEIGKSWLEIREKVGANLIKVIAGNDISELEGLSTQLDELDKLGDSDGSTRRGLIFGIFNSWFKLIGNIEFNKKIEDGLTKQEILMVREQIRRAESALMSYLPPVLEKTDINVVVMMQDRIHEFLLKQPVNGVEQALQALSCRRGLDGMVPISLHDVMLNRINKMDDLVSLKLTPWLNFLDGKKETLPEAEAVLPSKDKAKDEEVLPFPQRLEIFHKECGAIFENVGRHNISKSITLLIDGHIRAASRSWAEDYSSRTRMTNSTRNTYFSPAPAPAPVVVASE